ncbi:MAG: aminotransferase class III-fold pyridoxal phosphate-dependent enzyme [Eubacteriaceae bacterium]|nr:aminotransferase class III-fold pyridoxal phosphate-dependent enzyme [Eubacteriaceae bacterium]
MSKLINEYNYDAIHEQAMYLMKHRKHFKQSALDKWMEYFNTKCIGSKEEAEKAKLVIPGGIQHNLANNHPFALSVNKADGPYLYDIDGNRYIDFLCAGGPIILGNNYPAVRDAAIAHIQENSSITGLYSTYERELAEFIHKHMPGVEMFRALGSGTEANIIAIRLARAFTKKKHIIRFMGGYHGWSDQLAYNDNGVTNSMLNGIPSDCYQNTHEVPINDIEALEATILKYKDDGGVAAFIMEAVGQDSGAVPTSKEYHQAARELCDKYDMLLIYDEVVTGFRLGMGGAQSIFGTHPDITVFGKIIGGGFGCAGGVGGRREIMEMLSAGVDVTGTKVKVGGTMTANPLTTLAGLTVLKELEKQNVHEQLDKASAYFMKGIEEISEKYDVPALLFHHSSILHIDIAGVQHVPYCVDPEDKEEFNRQITDAYTNYLQISMALAAEGLIIANGGKTYLPYGSIGILDDALDVYDRVFSQLE